MIAVCLGTRPEAIKLAEVLHYLRDNGAPFKVVLTGQHRELLQGTPIALYDAIDLGMKSDGNVLRWTQNVQPNLQATLKRLQPDLIVVQGDTMSALAGARSATALNIPLAHVEAGLRSHSSTDPWPEENIRREISKLATFHYAPTDRAVGNLIAEGIPSAKLTGNPGVSTLLHFMLPSVGRPENMPPKVVVTLHRRELTMSDRLAGVINAIVTYADEHPHINIVWPVHPSFEKWWIRGDFRVPSNLYLTKPLPYVQFNTELKDATGVLTDSGGVQEDAATLGIPCAVLRYVLDRPESVEIGVARRFDPNSTGVVAALNCLVSDDLPHIPTLCYGEAQSASRIANHLTNLLD